VSECNATCEGLQQFVGQTAIYIIIGWIGLSLIGTALVEFGELIDQLTQRIKRRFT
jgi:hypothetical protein